MTTQLCLTQAETQVMHVLSDTCPTETDHMDRLHSECDRLGVSDARLMQLIDLWDRWYDRTRS